MQPKVTQKFPPWLLLLLRNVVCRCWSEADVVSTMTTSSEVSVRTEFTFLLPSSWTLWPLLSSGCFRKWRVTCCVCLLFLDVLQEEHWSHDQLSLCIGLHLLLKSLCCINSSFKDACEPVFCNCSGSCVWGVKPWFSVGSSPPATPPTLCRCSCDPLWTLKWRWVQL